MTWLTAYEHHSTAIKLVFDSAWVHGGGAATIAELYLGYVVDGLNPPSSYEGRSLDADETRVVWLAAYVQMWEELESIHESAHAHSDVTSATANRELAYIVDKQHHGKLAFSLNDLMDWS